MMPIQGTVRDPLRGEGRICILKEEILTALRDGACVAQSDIRAFLRKI